jgi:inward rectifier potassium channel
MQDAAFDPGLTNQFSGTLRRAINRDGSFNVRRRGTSWHDFHPYLQLISISWPAFIGFAMASYLVLNTIFACVYWMVGSDQLHGAEAPTAGLRFMNVFFFSAQTLTTVGYGGITPHGLVANIVASIEAMFGVFGFALGTGLLFGRFSKPSARIEFSNEALVAPYQDITSLQFRLVNRRPNQIMELEARVMLMTVEMCDQVMKRNYVVLPLERPGIFFFPLTWTVVHPINSDSPLFGKTKEDLERLQAELLILVKGYDDTFSQMVNARYSYRYDEFVWDARFTPAFEIDKEGAIDVYVDRISDHKPVKAIAG